LSYESNFISAASLAGIDYGDVLLALLHEALSRKQHEALSRKQEDIPLPVLLRGELHAQAPGAQPDREGG
jgi:hypothetical protein